MAFLRFTRDKRGYENFYLVEASTNRRGKTRTRVLYWFRTPPNVKVGREPFDDDVRRTLESQNPGVTFDWRKIVETPIPSADAEHWRERRRVERAERAARKAASVVEGSAAADSDARAETVDEANLEEASVENAESIDAGAMQAGEDLDVEGAETLEADDIVVDAAERQADALAPTEESLVAAAATIDPALSVPAGGQQRRRRRRRRRKRGQGSLGSPGSQGSGLLGSRGALGSAAPGVAPQPDEVRESTSNAPSAPSEPNEPSEPNPPGEPSEPTE